MHDRALKENTAQLLALFDLPNLPNLLFARRQLLTTLTPEVCPKNENMVRSRAERPAFDFAGPRNGLLENDDNGRGI